MPTEEKVHARFSASHMDRVIACPGSVQLSEKAPEPPPSKYAEEGTKAHECFEAFIKGMNDPNKVRRELAKKKYPLEMIDHAHHARNYVYDLVRKSEGNVEVFSEQKVDLTWIDPEAGGTLDCAIVDVFGALTVIDYKYGKGHAVEAIENVQLQTYALGMAHKYNWCFDEIRHIIIQPRAEHDKGPVRVWNQKIKNLKTFTMTVVDAINLAKSKSPPLNPDPQNQCRWCPAAPICPAISKKALAQAQIDFTPEVKGWSFPDAKSLSPLRLGQILSAGEKLEFWLGEIKSHAHHIMSQGKEIPGWKLVEKRSIRKWTDEEKISQLAHKKFGNKAFKTELLSPKQLELATKDKDFVAKHSSSISSGLTLVPQSDTREATNQARLNFDIEGEQKCMTSNRKQNS